MTFEGLVKNTKEDIKQQLLREAVFEAQRFIKRAEKSYEAFQSGEESWLGSPSFAAAKRSSMDLSQSLINLRKGESK